MIREDLYTEIKHSMPIPCVDVLVLDHDYVLLLRRANDPAKGLWWFPGGRILHGESRKEAARRIVLKECALDVSAVKEAGTAELFLPHEEGYTTHGITTVFFAKASRLVPVEVDEQAHEGRWFSIQSALELELHPFVRRLLNEYLVSKAGAT